LPCSRPVWRVISPYDSPVFGAPPGAARSARDSSAFVSTEPMLFAPEQVISVGKSYILDKFNMANFDILLLINDIYPRAYILLIGNHVEDLSNTQYFLNPFYAPHFGDL
jgi:hypothetical protein